MKASSSRGVIHLVVVTGRGAPVEVSLIVGKNVPSWAKKTTPETGRGSGATGGLNASVGKSVRRSPLRNRSEALV